MFSSQFFLVTFVLAFMLCNVGASHIRTGNVHIDGEIDTAQGFRQYTTDAVLEKPVICWEDLVEDHVTVAKCTNSSITFVGDIDREDYDEGIIVTFPADVYKLFGCPTQPYPEGQKEPEVIFRLIESVHFGRESVTVHTSFIDPGLVVPTISVEIGALVNAAAPMIKGNNTKSWFESLKLMEPNGLWSWLSSL